MKTYCLDKQFIELEMLHLDCQHAEGELQVLMLPKDPKDKNNVFLEIRAGTGGDEAAIFSGDLFRMYSRYAESKRWSIEVVSERAGDHGGYKELITRVVGDAVYQLIIQWRLTLTNPLRFKPHWISS